MGWADYGKDSRGRPIGYAHEATCDAPDCVAKIDRGLAYACGCMHLETSYGCEGYFCEDHLVSVRVADASCYQVCESCYDLLRAEGQLLDEGEEEV